MAKQTLNANLFRFVTLRNPQLIEEKDKDPGFVFHPDETKSPFYEAVKTLPDDQKQAALQVVSDSFPALKRRIDVKKVNGNLYIFSSWLMQNKNTLSFASINANLQDVALLSTANELIIWDNLIYQTINKESVYVRESLIKLLIANKFLKVFLKLAGTVAGNYVFTEEENKEFARRAHASVVISKVLFDNTPKPQTINSVNIKYQNGLINNNIEVAIAKKRIKSYNTFLEELKKTEIVFDKANKKSYDLELKKHNDAIDKLIDEAIPVIVKKIDENGNTIDVETYPDLKLPKFIFQKEAAITEAYLQDKLASASLNIFKNEGLDIYDDFSEVVSEVKFKIKKEEAIVYRRSDQKSKKVQIGGAKINLNQKAASQPFCFRVGLGVFSSGEFGFGMEIGTDYANAFVTSAAVKLTNVQSGVEYNNTSVQMMGTGINTMTPFFDFEPFPYEIGEQFTLSGEFTLDDGRVFTFSATSTVNLSNGIINLGMIGCAKPKTTETGGTTPTLTNTAPVYGVTNLGIADFRRVEQEVCCYVPGEVSHIENILAREYKERSTRSLLSSETTIERTDETERENLTDTTTTERNEMQSEVASVLSEDQTQSQGANAGVSGEFKPGKIRWNANAFFDSSSSSSVSNSNSQAQTYAQEVTERAMERIVQKTSIKRTTRILKEFEENNKHGFDNTKGDNHITGVYRWVDKIYKNSLINYGKRLMYEFAIPEPSKFFKKAIEIEIEDNTIDSEIIISEPPNHPSTNGMENAGSLNEGNYQSIASYYGAEVNAPLELYNYTGTSFTKSQIGGDGGNRDNKAPSDTIKVPNGYKAVAAKTSGKSNGQAYVTVAGLNLGINSGYFVGIWPYYLEEVPVSAYFEFNWITNVNIVIKCVRTDQAYKQWQNETFSAIIEAYEQQLREFNETAQANEILLQTDSEKVKFNPLFNRSIEKREIKRIAIELLTEQKGYDVSKDDYDDANVSSGVSKVIKNADLQLHAVTVKFFEQAFDWEIMAYTFYPYFYAEEKDWTNLFQEQEAADPLFQAFLQSGMARAVVPIRPGFEDAVNWYMETGEIWNGEGLVIDQDDDLYVSVAEEMQTIQGVVEGTWETKLPTALTILQAKSAFLEDEGLPCFCKEHAENNPIKPSTDIIGGVNGVGTTTL